MTPDLQKLQDMLGAMQQQRDQALNSVVLAYAEIAALKRTVAEQGLRIKELEATALPKTEGVAP